MEWIKPDGVASGAQVNFPLMCVDNFLPDPHRVRDLALQLEYNKSPYNWWPGKRSKTLSTLNNELFIDVLGGIARCVVDLYGGCELSWGAEAHFQLNESVPQSADPIYKRGWIHVDSHTLLAGILFLDPEPQRDAGLIAYTPKMPIPNTKISEWYEGQFSGNSNYDSQGPYIDGLKDQQEWFDESIVISNEFNRLVLIDQGQFHGASYKTNGQDRLTLLVSIEWAETSSPLPLQRMRNNYD